MMAICASHSPLMRTEIEVTDSERQEGFRNAIARARASIERYQPELVVVFGPDHFNGLFYDLMPPFCIGVAAQSSADWGLEPESLDVPRDVALACVRALHSARFDPAVSFRMKVDHGTTIPLHLLTGGLSRYPVLPIVIDCAADPRPSFRRVREFGAAVGLFLHGLGKRVVLIGSGGLSHDPPTPRFETAPAHVAERLIARHVPSAEELVQREARVLAAARAMIKGEGPCQPPSEVFDREFVAALLRNDLRSFDRYTDELIDREAGFGGHEVRCWIAAMSALHATGTVDTALHYYSIIPEWITGMAVMEARHREEPARPAEAGGNQVTH